jgi:hypothetical protein
VRCERRLIAEARRLHAANKMLARHTQSTTRT